MFFDGYEQHSDAKVRQSLLWEYDEMEDFDWKVCVQLLYKGLWRGDALGIFMQS